MQDQFFNRRDVKAEPPGGVTYMEDPFYKDLVFPDAEQRLINLKKIIAQTSLPIHVTELKRSCSINISKHPP